MSSTTRDERVYEPRVSVVFHKTREEWGELSNMAAGFPLVVGGEQWLTAEALYQACRFPRFPDVQRTILEQKSPMAAKMISKPFREKTRADWDTVRTPIMRWVLRVKLAQNFDRFASLLLKTGEQPIVERSHKDRFWGAVLDEQCLLRGANVLGRLLMELRKDLQSRDAPEFQSVDAPLIDEFRLCGERIERVCAGDRPRVSARLF